MITPLTTDDAHRFVDVCQSAGYSEETLSETLGTSIPPPPNHLQISLFLEQSAAPSPLNCLCRLFFLGTPVKTALAETLLPERFISICIDCGLLRYHASNLQPMALIVPCGGLWITSDLYESGTSRSDDFVLPVNYPARHLMQFSIRRQVQTTLDLCSGSALHGLAASDFSQHVVASDLNPRAALFAQFNAALNNRDNLECLTGNLFSTVADRKFDLILCNPPFVISPSIAANYQNNPLELDHLCCDILQAAPDYLEEGGFCQVICEWVAVEGEDWQDRLRDWLGDIGCDVWIVEANRQLAETYVRSRSPEMPGDGQEIERRTRDWQSYLAEMGVVSIHGGLIFLRRRESSNWLDIGQVTRDVRQPIGEAIWQGFRGRDLLFAADDDERLLNSRLCVATGLCLDQKSRWTSDGWQPDPPILQLEAGLIHSIGIDSHICDLLMCFDGHRNVDAVLRQFAQQNQLSDDALQDECLKAVRVLLEHGCLTIS